MQLSQGTILQRSASKRSERATKARQQNDDDDQQPYDPRDAIKEQDRFNSIMQSILDGNKLQKSNYETIAISEMEQDHERNEKLRVRKASSRHVWDPDSNNKTMWDIFILLLVFYSLIDIPYRIAFNTDPGIVGRALNILVPIMFAIDMLVSFNTGYYDSEKEKIEWRYRKIACHYLKTWFFIDFITTVPIASVMARISDSSSFESLQFVRLLRVFRLMKAYQHSNINRLLEEYHIHPSIVRLVALFGQICVFSHLLCCIWYYIGTLNPAGVEDPDGRSWLSRYEFGNQKGEHVYIAALYYIIVTMLTVGYGDYHPFTLNERIFGIAVMVAGTFVFSSLMSKVTDVINGYGAVERVRKGYLDEIKAFMSLYDVPQTLRRQIKDAYNFYLEKRSMHNESSILERLPGRLVERVLAESYNSLFQSIDLLSKHKNVDFFASIVTKLKPYQISTGVIIRDVGDIIEEISFVQVGTIRICKNDKVLGFCSKGHCFGHAEYIKKTTKSLAQYVANSECTLYSLSYRELDSAIRNNSSTGSAVYKDLQEYQQRFSEIAKSRSKYKPAKNVARRQAAHSSKKGAEGFKKIGRNSKIQVQDKESYYINGILHLDVPTADLKNILEEFEGEVNDVNDELFLHTVIEVGVKDKDTDKATEHGYRRRLMTVREMNKAAIIYSSQESKVLWDAWIALLIIYAVLVTPVEIAFHSVAFPRSNAVNLVVNLFFIADVVLTFRTSVPVNEPAVGLMISGQEIARRYICSPWFTIDLLSSLPFDLFLSSLGIVRILRLFRLFRLTKLGKAFKLSKYVNRVEELTGLPPATFDLLAMLAQVYLVAHLMACVWWGMCDVASKEGTQWYWNSDMVYTSHMPDSDLASRYMVSIYWTFTTMSTIGYGDIYANNTNEQVITIFLIFIGVSVFGFMIANVQNVIDRLNVSQGKKEAVLTELREYLDEKKVSKELKNLIIQHKKDNLSLTSPFDEESLFSRLPNVLSNKILLFRYKETIEKIPLFKYISNYSTVVHIFERLDPLFFAKGEVIILQGEKSIGIMFLTAGLGQIYHKKEKNEDSPSEHESSGSDDDSGELEENLDHLNSPQTPFDDVSSKLKRAVSMSIPGSGTHSSSNSNKSTNSRRQVKRGDSSKWSIGRRQARTGTGGSESPSHKINLFSSSEKDDEELAVKEAIGDYAGLVIPGMVFGHKALLARAKHERSVRAFERCVCYLLADEEIQTIAKTTKALATELQFALAQTISVQNTGSRDFRAKKRVKSFQEELQVAFRAKLDENFHKERELQNTIMRQLNEDLGDDSVPSPSPSRNASGTLRPAVGPLSWMQEQIEEFWRLRNARSRMNKFMRRSRHVIARDLIIQHNTDIYDSDKSFLGDRSHYMRDHVDLEHSRQYSSTRTFPSIQSFFSSTTVGGTADGTTDNGQEIMNSLVQRTRSCPNVLNLSLTAEKWISDRNFTRVEDCANEDDEDDDDDDGEAEFGTMPSPRCSSPSSHKVPPVTSHSSSSTGSHLLQSSFIHIRTSSEDLTAAAPVEGPYQNRKRSSSFPSFIIAVSALEYDISETL